VVFVITLVAAMFGSILTLASFIKFIHAVFLGQARTPEEVKEVPVRMRAAVIILAGLCVIAGVVPSLIVRYCIEPAISGDVITLGVWNSAFVVAWLLIGSVVCVIMWRLLSAATARKDAMFIGGEPPGFGPRFPATEFYRTFDDIPVVRRLYALIKAEAFDVYVVIYRVSRACAYAVYAGVDRLINLITVGAGYAVLAVSGIVRGMHTGTLDLYLIWSLAGLLVILFVALGSS
jgi:NADH:ubiquinone oxidoreductase subunit 5 (subunit L)/multisubunit Na+/H+ antiporter MnhA subunit